MDGIDIYKAGGILIRDNKLLVAKSKNKDFYAAPGGKIEAGETPKQALKRELFEEFEINTKEDDFEDFGNFYATSADGDGRKIRMDVFLVKTWDVEPTVSSEIEEIKWIDTSMLEGLVLGSIFEHDVIPKLKTAGLIN